MSPPNSAAAQSGENSGLSSQGSKRLSQAAHADLLIPTRLDILLSQAGDGLGV